MNKFIPIAIAAALVLGACGGGNKHTAADAKSAIAAAEHETSRAKKKNNLWKSTGKIIKKAKKALKAGETDKAVKLANKAKRQSTNALAQAAAQKKAGPVY